MLEELLESPVHMKIIASFAVSFWGCGRKPIQETGEKNDRKANEKQGAELKG